MSADENITKPTIETVLDRINSLSQKFDARMIPLDDGMVSIIGRLGAVEDRLGAITGRLGAVEDRMSALEGEVGEIRNDLRTGLRMVERKIDLLNKNILQVAADQKELEERFENLESKAS